MPKVANHERRREEISEAALRVMEARGLEGAGMREIAREAGYTTGVLTHYFRGKRELLAHAFELLVERWMARVAEVAGERGLLAGMCELMPMDDRRRLECRVWLVLMAASLREPGLAEEIRGRYEEVRRAIGRVAEEATGGDARDLGDELLATVDGITVAALADPERYPPARQEEILRRAFRRLGLAGGSGEG